MVSEERFPWWSTSGYAPDAIAFSQAQSAKNVIENKRESVRKVKKNPTIHNLVNEQLGSSQKWINYWV